MLLPIPDPGVKAGTLLTGFVICLHHEAENEGRPLPKGNQEAQAPGSTAQAPAAHPGMRNILSSPVAPATCLLRVCGVPGRV